MRKLIVWLLLASMLLMMTPGAYAEESFSMAGYDDKETGHVWNENKFFKRMYDRVEWNGEKLHLNFDLQQYTDRNLWNDAKAKMLSGEMALPDVLFKASLTTLETQEMYDKGLLLDLSGLLQENAPNLYKMLLNHPEWLQAITLPNGAIVALPYIDQLQYTNAMWINKTWLDRLGLKMPTTAEELTDVLRAFRDNDMNGDGDKNDEVPLTFYSMWELRFLAHAFGINANDYYITTKDGKVSQILTTDENRKFLEWLKLLWDEDLIDHDGFSSLRSFGDTTKEGSKLIYGVMFATAPSDLVPAAQLGQYTLLEPLKYNDQQVYRDLTGDVIRGTFAISTACKEPEKILQWVDYLYTEEGFILAEAGQDASVYGNDDAEFKVHEDGRWSWIETSSTLTTHVLPAVTLRAGASMPGASFSSFQKRIDNDETVRLAENIEKLRRIDELPYPMVWMTLEQQAELSELIFRIGVYAEQEMVWFITGDKPFNDNTWKAFCNKLEGELNIGRMVSILQEAYDNRHPGALITVNPDQEPIPEAQSTEDTTQQ